MAVSPYRIAGVGDPNLCANLSICWEMSHSEEGAVKHHVYLCCGLCPVVASQQPQNWCTKKPHLKCTPNPAPAILDRPKTSSLILRCEDRYTLPYGILLLNDATFRSDQGLCCSRVQNSSLGIGTHGPLSVTLCWFCVTREAISGTFTKFPSSWRSSSTLQPHVCRRTR
ncbi:uncharacterized protein PV07_08323 [Cladophialophora immunda]|uniref:Uncharacterized protein n=1 Tax=Cladophialophora immunda TaxID=569365 RepID=A0A0D2CC62_9EURO|nr:uncharacterized protein PV07_08323 [Cladophialophora immunda]KIW28683.1 hypothetical protein PV07_08323 [Cladophialophora immunda]